MKYKLVIDNQDDLTNVIAHCTCVEWAFIGDWDDLCLSWFEHQQHPRFEYLAVTKNDHEGTLLLTREAAKNIREMLAGD